MKKSEYSISVTGKDRPGIIAAVTRTLFVMGGNLEDASMTILCGQFSMILLVSFKKRVPIELIAKNLHSLEIQKKLAIHIDQITSKSIDLTKGKQTQPYLLSIFGKDQSGIVYRISSLMAKHGLNIVDLDSKLLHSGSKNVYALLMEVEIPKSFKASLLEVELKKIARKLNVDVNLKPVETTTL